MGKMKCCGDEWRYENMDRIEYDRWYEAEVGRLKGRLEIAAQIREPAKAHIKLLQERSLAAEEERNRLRNLVEEAYIEGVEDGLEHFSDWEGSESKAMLDDRTYKRISPPL